MNNSEKAAIRMPRIRVALHNCRFYSYHGVMQQEKIAGNEFEVSLEVAYLIENDQKILADDLNSTISYADLYEIVERQMNISADLLETVACRIASEIRRKWSSVESGYVEIIKLTPPIPHFTGHASVSYEF